MIGLDCDDIVLIRRRHFERSEAIQWYIVDCFAALEMTTHTDIIIP
ncbi:hypothetical protein SAMN05518849_10863 [Sphingobium sp. AP50]|nr:hypothetical protein SAMN05518849_10863 [Sphingobium sp. AP50]